MYHPAMAVSKSLESMSICIFLGNYWCWG